MRNGNIERTLYNKGQGKYDIYIQIDPSVFQTNTKHYPKGEMTITVLNAKTQQTVGEESITVNHSWTVEELTNEMNDALSSICDIELLTSYRQIVKNNDSDGANDSNGSNGSDGSDGSDDSDNKRRSSNDSFGGGHTTVNVNTNAQANIAAYASQYYTPQYSQHYARS